METIIPDVVSTATIKPQEECHDRLMKQPFKICLLDQMSPQTYLPFIFFYQNDQNDPAFSARLKISLSEALARFYPFSGRFQNDNILIHDFHMGVPFTDARVSCQMSDFLANSSRTIMSSLNRFLPFRPVCYDKSNPDTPQLAVQLTRFSCGGIAIGVSVYHRIADTTTAATFLNIWAAMTRGKSDHHDLDLDAASSRFPAVDSLPQHCTSMCDNIAFRGGNLKSERFAFDEEALAALKSKAKSDVVPNPTRVQALTALIWKSIIAASRTVVSSNSSRTYVIFHAVNIRSRTQNNDSGPTTGTAVGNLLSVASAVYKDVCARKIELSGLVELVSESLSKVNNDYMRSIRGNEALDLMTGLEEALSEDPEAIFTFSSWTNMGLKDVDFGLGKPIWVGLFGGEGGPEMTNAVFFTDASWCGGIEVWVNIDEKVLAVMKNDPELLAFAAIDPPIPLP